MKVLIVVPIPKDKDYKMEELGPCYVAAYARKQGYTVELMTIINEESNYDKIEILNPDLVGITVYNQTAPLVHRFIVGLKARFPHVTVSLGGCFPSIHYNELMRDWPDVDYIIKGEGEIAFYKLLQYLESKLDSVTEVPNLVYRVKDEIRSSQENIFVDDLDVLPFPARDLLIDSDLNVASIFTSRGCTRNCSFCLSHVYWKKWRGVSPKRVVDEIENIIEETGLHRFLIHDNSFEDPGFSRERMIAIAQEIINRKVNITYWTFFRAESYKNMDSELVKILRKSGLASVEIGIETGNEEDLKLYGKTASMEDNKNCLKFLRENKIYPYIGFMNFNPYSALERLRENCKFLREYKYASNVERFITFTELYEGTKLIQKVRQDGLLREDSTYEKNKYHYVNPEIGKMHDFLTDYFNYERGMTENLSKLALISTYSRFFSSDIANIETHFLNNGKLDEYEIVQEYDEKYESILDGINDYIADWFDELLDILEVEWNDEKAMDVTNKYFVNDYIIAVSGQLHELYMKLYFKLVRKNKNYIRLFRRVK